MKQIFYKIYLVYEFLLIVVIFLILYPAFRYFLADEKRYHRAHKLRVFWAKMLLVFSFTKQKIEYEVPFDKDKLYVIVSNHTSYIDIAALAVAVPIDFNYIAKIELAKVPLFGIFFRTIDIAVNRHSAIQSAKAYLKANQQLKNRVKSVAIFPEGGIKSIVPKLSPFKEGPFKMAVDNQVYILPISMPDNYKRMFPNANGATPGRMRVYIHQPIDTTNIKPEDIPALTKQVHDIIKSKL